MSNGYNEEIKCWIEKIKKGDKSSFEKLFLKYYEPLCKFAWRYVRSSHVSEELVQDVYLEIWESRANLNSGKNIRSYLYQSVKNRSLNYLRHQEIARDYNQKIEWLNRTPITQIHQYSGQSEFVRQTKKAIEDLPEGARQVYKLSRKDGLTYSEISEVLGISVKTVESQMSRALKILRQSLSEYASAEVKISVSK